MKRLAIVVLPLTVLLLGCDKETATKADKTTPKTVKVVRGPCKVEVSLRGVLGTADMAEVRFSPKAWTGPFTIRKVAEHGIAVKKGDVLVELDTEKLDQALNDVTTEQRLTELSLRQAEAELPVMEKLVPIDLAEAERLKKQAAEDQERFLKIDRPHTEESAREQVKSSTHYVEYAKEELKQLQKMYRDKDLTEETEEIILKRQRHQVEQAEFFLKSAKLSAAQVMEVTLPRREITFREAVHKLTLAHDKAQAMLPLSLSQKRTALEKLRQELDKSRERYVKLKHDRTLMTLVAPADGVVFFGRATYGQFQAIPNNPILAKLAVGGSLSPEEVFITVVPPRPTLVYATVEEKDLHQLKAGQSGRVTPVGYPDLKLAGKITEVNPVRLPTGSYLAMVALDGAADAALRPAMNCTVKVPVYEKRDALLLPTAAVQSEEADEEQTYVNLVEEGGKTVKRPVKVGKMVGGKTEILEGLKVDDEVLAAKPEEK
jgi:HlyD family secretion protein